MSFNKSEDSFVDKLIETVKQLYVDVKIKYKSDNIDDFKKNELEKLKDINVFTLIEYLKESIDIYVNYRIDEVKNSTEFIDDKQKSFPNSDEEAYEKIIKKLEADKRNHIKVEYELKLQNEYLESKLEEYENVLAEMEKLQSKVENYERKLCSPEYLEMNKKENEIIILRAENSNLKTTIVNTEKNFENLQIKFSEYKKEKDKIILKNQDLIHKLTKKLKKFEESSLLESLQNSICDKTEAKSLNNSKLKNQSKTIMAQTSRINNGISVANLFNSDGKGKLTERKYSAHELMLVSDNMKRNELTEKEILSNLIQNELSYENFTDGSSDKKFKREDNINTFSHLYEKLNNNIKDQNEHNSKKRKSSEKNNFKRSSSVNEFNNQGNMTNNYINNNNLIKNINNSNGNNLNYELSKSEMKEQSEKTKISIGYDSKLGNNNINNQNLIASQTYRKNILNNHSVNFNNFNNITKVNDSTKTPISGNSHQSITNFNNNNIIINNKYEAENSKPITNLNMIFKFKTILNEESNSKINKVIKIDGKKILRNPSSIKNNTEKNNNSLKNSTNGNNSNNNKEKKEKEQYNSSICNNNLLRKKNDSDVNRQVTKKIVNMNSTLKSGSSTSKNKMKNNNNLNEFKHLDTLRYSINQLKDFLNPNFNSKTISKSKSRSRGKVGMGNNNKK